MSHADRAAEHARLAEEWLAATEETRIGLKSKLNREVQAALGTGHATLALYYQREAEREEGRS